jgi:hypothetical protein
MFNQNHRIVGQLHGGGAACGNNLKRIGTVVSIHPFHFYAIGWLPVNVL